MIKIIKLRMAEKEINQTQLAELIGVNDSRASAILSGIKKGNVKLETLQRVLKALDLQLKIEEA